MLYGTAYNTSTASAVAERGSGQSGSAETEKHPEGCPGSPRRGKSRTFLDLTILAGSSLGARGAARLAYHFEGAAPLDFFEPEARPTKLYRNPIVLAQAWHGMLVSGKCTSRADLARQLGVTRARVTQVLSLLDLAPEAVEGLSALGDPLPKPIVTEHGLRSFLKLPTSEQWDALREIISARHRASDHGLAPVLASA